MKNYRPEIDGLRAIAIILVICFHYFPELIKGGFVGVDIFFVISGYLITNIITTNLHNKSFSFFKFYGNRITRIFPSLIVVLFFSMLFGYFVLHEYEFIILGREVGGGAFFYSNILYWMESGYFDRSAESKPLIHLWSLAIEEQFYILFPLILYLSYKKKIDFLTTIIIFLIFSFVSNIFLTYSKSTAAFYLLENRGWELLIGSAISMYNPFINGHNFRKCKKFIFNLMSLIGLGIILISVIFIDRKSLFPGYLALLPTLGAGLILISGSNSLLNKYFLSTKTLTSLGLISYPIYLWHWLLYVFLVAIYSGTPPVDIRLALIFFVIFISYATYKFIELPIKNSASKYKNFILILLLFFLGLIGICMPRIISQISNFDTNKIRDPSWSKISPTAVYSHNINDRDKQVPIISTAKNNPEVNIIHGSNFTDDFSWPDSEIADSNCLGKYRETMYCRLSGSDQETVAIIGDSHANHFFRGLDVQFSVNNKTLVNLGASGCPPLLNISSNRSNESDWCNTANMNSLIKNIANNSKITTVILAANWNLYILGARFNTKAEDPQWELRSKSYPDLDTNPLVFTNSLQDTLNIFKNSGKKIIILKQIPELNFHPKSCIESRKISVRSQNGSCNISRSAVEKYLRTSNTIFNSIISTNPEILVIDPVNFLCSSGNCELNHDGLSLYRDEIHLSKYGSAYFAYLLIKNFPGIFAE